MNNNIISTILTICCIGWTIFSSIGYVLYKTRKEITSWEDGVKWILTAGFNWFYEEATGQGVEKNLPDFPLMLTNTEVLNLVNEFDKHPYETPILYSYTPNLQGVAWYDIHALGLSTAYTGLSNSQIKQMAEYVVQKYFMKTRNTQIFIYIRVASPIRLYFAIPLSENGRMLLEKQRQLTDVNNFSPINHSSYNGLNPSADLDSLINSESLEEEIDIFED